jgi:Undecaprenyl-phosphate glucose phosphotransferase
MGKEMSRPPSAEAEAEGLKVVSPAAKIVYAETSLNLQPEPAVSPLVVTGLWRLVEFLLASVVGVIIHALYLYQARGVELAYIIAIPSIALLAVMMQQILGTYRLSALKMMFRSAFSVIAGWSLAFLAALTFIFFLKFEGLSRLFTGAWYLSGLAALLIARFAFATKLRSMSRAGLMDRRTAIVGGGESAERLLRAIHEDDASDLRVFGLFDDRDDVRSAEVILGIPKLGSINDLVVLARNSRVDLILVALPVTAEGRILEMLKKLWILPVDIRLAAHSHRLKFRPRNYSYLGTIPVLDISDRPISDWGMFAKWMFDKVIGSLLLVLFSPVMLIVALAVKMTSRGPVFFRQKRYGFNNELIEVLKFRSMYHEMTDAMASRLVSKGDPRVTPVGRFMRRTSIDELPQLFNVVIKGDLSLVGPRPHAVHAKAENRLYDQVVDGYFARHKVKPGITGLAQVNGWRGETDTEEKIQKRVELDLQYIENWSLWLDAEVLLRTPISLFKSENAY